MLKSPDEVEPGQIVYLVPNTKLCGQWCWMRKTAVVEDPKTHWPYVKVSLTHKGETIDTVAHKDNINRTQTRTTKQEQRDGDMTGGTPDVKVKTMGRPVANPDDQMELF